MDKLDRIIGAAMAKKGLKKATDGSLVCFYATKWQTLGLHPISYANGQLKLGASSSAEAAEIQIRIEEITNFINEKIRYKAVRSVRIVIVSSKQ